MLDYLHGLIERPIAERTLQEHLHVLCYDLLGILQTCPAESKIVWYLPRCELMRDVRIEMSKILQEDGMKFYWKGLSRLDANGSYVWLETVDQAERVWHIDFEYEIATEGYKGFGG